jgi:hypothetical protein
MTDPQTLARIAEAFELMWGNFPDPTLLVQRDRTILAVNDAAARQGMEPGRKCFSYNPDPRDVENGACTGCQADQALDMGTAITCSCRLAAQRWILDPSEGLARGVRPRGLAAEPGAARHRLTLETTRAPAQWRRSP